MLFPRGTANIPSPRAKTMCGSETPLASMDCHNSSPSYAQATQEVVTRVPCSTAEEMNAAAESAAEAFKTWKKTSVMHRQRILFELAHLIRKNQVRVPKCVAVGGSFLGAANLDNTGNDSLGFGDHLCRARAGKP